MRLTFSRADGDWFFRWTADDPKAEVKYEVLFDFTNRQWKVNVGMGSFWQESRFTPEEVLPPEEIAIAVASAMVWKGKG